MEIAGLEATTQSYPAEDNKGNLDRDRKSGSCDAPAACDPEGADVLCCRGKETSDVLWILVLHVLIERQRTFPTNAFQRLALKKFSF